MCPLSKKKRLHIRKSGQLALGVYRLMARMQRTGPYTLQATCGPNKGNGSTVEAGRA